MNKSIYKILLLVIITWVSDVCQIIMDSLFPGKMRIYPFWLHFGKDGKTSWGDDDFYQIFFFSIPKDYTKPFYIRVFDPDCGGENDEIQGEFNTKTKFSVYGGKGVDPEKNEESRGLAERIKL